MPVTRSQSKALAAQEDSKFFKGVEQEQATKGPFVEWLDLDYSNNSILKQTDWKLILKEVVKVDGCRQITWTIPIEDDHRLWIIIHWWRRAQRDEFRQSDAMTQTMKEVIFLPDPGSPGNHRSSPNNKTLLIYRFMDTAQDFILDCFSKSSRPDMVYEVWTVYFPTEDIVSILHSAPHYRFPRMVNYRSLPSAIVDPIGAVLTQVVAFVSGEVEYKGRRCKRIAWFMDWKSRGEEEIYKETLHTRKKDREWGTVMECFIEELQSLGMVGYESCYAKFKEINTWT